MVVELGVAKTEEVTCAEVAVVGLRMVELSGVDKDRTGELGTTLLRRML